MKNKLQFENEFIKKFYDDFRYYFDLYVNGNLSNLEMQQSCKELLKSIMEVNRFPYDYSDDDILYKESIKLIDIILPFVF